MIAVAAIISVALFPSYGITISGNGTVTGTATTSPISMNVRVTRMMINSHTSLSGGAWDPFLVTVSIQNTGDLPCAVGTAEFTLNLTQGSPNGLYNIENISSDLMLTLKANTGGVFSVIPSAGFQYDGSIIVPPKTTLYCLATIDVGIDVNTSTGTFPTIGLSSVVPNISSIWPGNYPYDGSADGSIVDIANTLDNIYANLEYSGSNPSVISASGSTSDVQYNFSENLYVTLRRRIYPAVPIFADYEFNNTNDTAPVIAAYRVYVLLNIQATNNTGSNRLMQINNQLQYVLPMSDTVGNPVIDRFESDMHRYLYLVSGRYQNLYALHPIPDNPGQTVFQTGNSRTSILVHYDIPVGQTLTFSTPDLSLYFGSSLPVTTIPWATDEWSLLYRIYTGMQTPSGDTTEQNAEYVQQKLDDIHEREQQYYNDNAAAIASSGLGNFRFGQSQINAFGIINSQFAQVWNALGDYTLIYIFTLLLSLTVFIIRHEPTTKLKQHRESVKNERYERTQYYGRMNAQARAAESSGGSTFKNAIRRRSK